MSEITIETTQPDINVNIEGRMYLGESAKWAKFLAIVNFVLIGLMVILAFTMGSVMSSMAAYGGAGSAMSGGMMTTTYLIAAIISFFPAYMLFQFAVKTKAALADGTVSINDGLKQLKNYFVFNAVITIIALVFLAIAMLIMFIGLAAM